MSFHFNLNCDVKFCVKCEIVGYDLYLLSEVYRIAFKITEILCSLTFLVLLSYGIIRQNHIFAQSIIKVTNDGQCFYVWQVLFSTRTLGYDALSYPRRVLNHFTMKTSRLTYFHQLILWSTGPFCKVMTKKISSFLDWSNYLLWLC
jgi:hypothetical protein